MKRLLLVEDDRSLGATLCERLQREKYDVYWAETKQRALKKLGEGFWDLVILDIGLPDGSGFELARHIKEKTSLPIMFMTALSTAEHRLEGFEIGAADFIPKPFHLRELLLRVKHVLDSHPVQREISCNGRVIELSNRVIVQPGGEREYPNARWTTWSCACVSCWAIPRAPAFAQSEALGINGVEMGNDLECAGRAERRRRFGFVSRTLGWVR